MVARNLHNSNLKNARQCREKHEDCRLGCLMPWKALYMDELDGRIAALPCCLSWIKAEYGTVGEASLESLWNSDGAQRIRELLASDRQDEICDPHCPYLISENYGEAALREIDGPPEFVANQRLNNLEIAQRRTYLHSHPMLLKVLPTLTCNLHCTMCFQNHDAHFELPASVWEEINSLLPFTHEVTFQGGEVTIDDAFRAFLESQGLRDNPHVRVSLITNGTVLDKALQERLSQVRVNYMIVSVNAVTRETYRRISGKDMFDRVAHNLRTLSTMGSKHAKGNFSVYASFVVMRSNFHELPRFIEFAGNAGAQVQLLHVLGDRNGEDIFVRPDQHAALKQILDETLGLATGQARDQVMRICTILDSYRIPPLRTSDRQR